MQMIQMVQIELRLNSFIRLNMFHEKFVYKQISKNTTLFEIKLSLTQEDIGE